MAMTEMTRETHGAPSYQILLHTLGYARSDRVRPMHGKVCNEPSCQVNGLSGWVTTNTRTRAINNDVTPGRPRLAGARANTLSHLAQKGKHGNVVRVAANDR